MKVEKPVGSSFGVNKLSVYFFSQPEFSLTRRKKEPRINKLVLDDCWDVQLGCCQRGNFSLIALLV